jgi:asparagine synthase (glutamine-hydrolysing)
MCGIAGILSNNFNQTDIHRLEKMTHALKHRGPDGEGYWKNPEGTVAFGHRRLAVIDLSASAAQPFLYSPRYTIVFNGEIYNYQELKQTL